MTCTRQDVLIVCPSCTPQVIASRIWEGPDAPDRVAAALDSHGREFPGHQPFSESGETADWLGGTE
ncbi:MAG TPA: hypothetical protein VNO54_06550 [Streptosporangiaceae bacterium]|nr:hypothetical protein [Streptosporangiaceae bacterium]